MKKISQIELVSYVNEVDEKLKNKKYRDILYDKYLDCDQRKTKTDKRYSVISKLIKDNYQIKISETTVWRILKIKNASSSAFKSIHTGESSIKKTYNELFGIKENNMPVKQNLSIPSVDNIENNLREIKDLLETKKDSFPNNNKLNDIDAVLYELRKTVHKLMQYNDSD